MNILIGIFVILHGLVHLWYVTLSQGWVKFQAEMGWTGKSWLLSNFLDAQATGGIATMLYGLSTLIFLAAGIGVLGKQSWTQPWMLAASTLSALTILVFWDGNFSLLVQKGLLGFIISAGLLIATTAFNWPAF